ncbi:MAG: ATP-dependent DNA helicase [Clostridia bacterium]|nr:ATP-dependent DNA helicase [Clostridia bacterium]
MKYNKDANEIVVSLDEFVSVSRRGISRIAPNDELEPCSEAPSAVLSKKILGDHEQIPLHYSFEEGEYTFRLVGHADIVENGEITLLYTVELNPKKPRREELEISRGRAFTLGYMYAMTEGLDEVALKIVYASERSGDFDTREEKVTLKKLREFHLRCLGTLAKYARPEVERVTERLPSMAKLRFPFEQIRDGQSELVRATYRTLARGESLYACAPTGTGKTVSVLYPAIRLIGEGKEDKVFYLTPKTTTAEVARECLMLLSEAGARIRAISLSSKERSCPEGLICKKSAMLCKLSDARRLPDATLALYDKNITVVTLSEVREVAREFSVCPYELALSYSELCDAVICDINYLFDPRVYIRRYFDEGGRYAFLIDEAHNLAERAREMYSAELSLDTFLEKLDNPLIEPTSELRTYAPDIILRTKESLFEYLKDEIRKDKDGAESGATHLAELPSELYEPIGELALLLDTALRDSYRKKDELTHDRTEYLKELFYEIKRVYDTVERYDECYRTFIFYESGRLTLKLFSVDSGSVIKRILSKGHGTVFFSATLSPLEYYKSVLGGDGSSDTLEALSPFAPEALSVSIIDSISTRYSERERTLPAVSRAIAATLSPRIGNYMVFAPSFEYLEMLAGSFREKYPKIKVLEQRKDMTRVEKEAFLAEFEREREGYLVGFCVLGGIYSEGIDLVGKSLIGSVVVGIGMPALSYEREAIAEYYEEKLEAGKQYAYIYPGMNRVLQAAGRVIRHENDRGVIVLIDDRFRDPLYKKTIPALWRGMEYVGDLKELNERIKDFWREIDLEDSTR